MEKAIRGEVTPGLGTEEEGCASSKDECKWISGTEESLSIQASRVRQSQAVGAVRSPKLKYILVFRGDVQAKGIAEGEVFSPGERRPKTFCPLRGESVGGQ